MKDFANKVVEYLEKQEEASGRLSHIPVQHSPDQVRRAILAVKRTEEAEKKASEA